MLQALRDAWVFQKEDMLGWQIMDFSMTKMKQLAHMAEEVAENGMEPKFAAKDLNLSASVGVALKNALESVKATQKLHSELLADDETAKHKGLMLNLDLSIKQEAFEKGDIEGWLKK